MLQRLTRTIVNQPWRSKPDNSRSVVLGIAVHMVGTSRVLILLQSEPLYEGIYYCDYLFAAYYMFNDLTANDNAIIPKPKR
jgi:hypothetical protein